MKLVFASDSFKGSLSSEETIRLLTRAAHEVFGSCECLGTAIADGGEGTAEAVIAARAGHKIKLQVQGPLLTPIDSFYGHLNEEQAILEMAAASGLPLVPDALRDPRKTSSYGTGELIRNALERGYTDITIAIGGSATNDGGTGCMRALGVRFLDAQGQELAGRGEDLARIAAIDCSGLHPAAASAHFTVMCDVNNPLCGPTGATYTFGRQKGGTPEILDELEAGMQHYREKLIEFMHCDPNEIPGSGAAGGLGAALCVFLNAELKSGIETVLQLIDFDALIEDADLVVTGEGRTDWQSCYGKVLYGVGQHCAARNIPVLALSGGLGEGAEKILEYGISSLMTTVNGIMPLEEAIANAESLYYQAAIRMFSMVNIGRKMRG